MVKNNISDNTNKINIKKKSRGKYVSRACDNCKKSHRKCSEGYRSCGNCLRRNLKCSNDIFIVQSNNDNGNNNNNNCNDVDKGKI